MNILCTICSDLVNQAENTYVTKCGHIFHHHCLAQWIARSKTCPQCRNKVTDKCMFRMYPMVSNENSSEDAATLQSRLDDAQLQLRQQRVKYKEKEDKLAVANADLKRQDDLLKSYEKRLVSFDSKVLALREQVDCLNIQNLSMERVKDENEALKKNIQTLNGLQKVLNATSDDVEQMLHTYTDVRTIATFATALKRALCDSEAKRNESRDRLHAAKKLLDIEKKKVGNLKSRIMQLEDEVLQAQEKYDVLKTDIAYSDLAKEKRKADEQEERIFNEFRMATPPTEDPNSSFTKNRRGTNDCVDGDIKDLERKKNAAWLNVLCSKATRMCQTTNEKDDVQRKRKRYNEMKRKIRAIIRMKNEEKKERENEREFSDKIRANVTLFWKQNEMVTNIENSDSPYLMLKQGSALTLAPFQRAHKKPPKPILLTEPAALPLSKQLNIGKKLTSNGTKHSIFHNKNSTGILSSHPTVDISYDGLGGHSKPDVFPVPKNIPVKSYIPKLSAKHKLKRPTASGSQDIEKMLNKKIKHE